jgi:hypothetical protein
VTTSRVREVQLRLRVPAELASASESIRATVERELIVRILEQVERLLHARFGATSVIRIRRIAVSWRLDQLELASVDVVLRLAQDLAEQLIAELDELGPEEQLRPRSESVAWFASERHSDAAYLADVADGMSTRWIHTQSSAPETWQAVVMAGSDSTAELVGYLAKMDRIETALALAADDVIAQVVAATPPHLLQIVTLAAARITARRSSPAAPVPASFGNVAHAPGNFDALAREPSDVVRVTHPLQPSAPPNEAAALPADTARITAPELREPEIVAYEQPPRMHDEAITDTSSPVAVETAFAGLFYLAGRVLEIELAERLWAAGVPEGDVLAHVAAMVVGSTGDPAWKWFGGVFGREPLTPDVPLWAAAEIVETIQHALGRRLVRFGVEMSPAALDARLEELTRALTSPTVLAPTLHRIVARGAAALCVMVAARLDREPSLVELRAICARPGRLVLAPDAIHVIMSADCFDIDHRRAGLDLNPGHMPWLGRRIELELVGLSADGH